MIVSSQSISKTIIELEKELDQSLFIRQNRRLYPTPAAVKLKMHAEKILAEFDAIKGSACTLPSRKELKIYCTFSVVEYLGTKFMTEFLKYRPDLMPYLIEMPDKQAQDMLKTGEPAVAILSDPSDPGIFNSIRLFSCSYSYVLAKDHPLASKDVISSKDLAEYSIVGKGSSFQLYINQRAQFDSGTEPYVMFETTSYHLSMQIAKTGAAAALVPTFLAEMYAPSGTLIRPARAEEIQKPFYLVKLAGNALDEGMTSFCGFLREWTKKYPAP